MEQFLSKSSLAKQFPEVTYRDMGNMDCYITKMSYTSAWMMTRVVLLNFPIQLEARYTTKESSLHSYLWLYNPREETQESCNFMKRVSFSMKVCSNLEEIVTNTSSFPVTLAFIFTTVFIIFSLLWQKA